MYLVQISVIILTNRYCQRMESSINIISTTVYSFHSYWMEQNQNDIHNRILFSY